MVDTNEQLFLRVIEAGGLKAAAEQIGSDPSAVSRRISDIGRIAVIQASTGAVVALMTPIPPAE